MFSTENNTMVAQPQENHDQNSIWTHSFQIQKEISQERIKNNIHLNVKNNENKIDSETLETIEIKEIKNRLKL